jgi:peptidoglycan hydrolase-like protein with peptidoglycan-binding domain
MAQIAALTGASSAVRDLQIGMVGSDVKTLQVYLNGHGFPVAASGAGSSGNETTKFGAATKAAVIKLQTAAGISPAAGYLGAKTRAYIAAHP